MSHKATNWAVEQRGLKPATKVVLWNLADRHNPDYGCFPSQEQLAYDCEMSRSSINNHLNILEENGLIRRVQARNDKTFQQENTRYFLAFEEGFVPKITPTQNGGNPPKPCSKSGHGEATEPVSKNGQIPCPKNDDSRVQNLDTNPVREPVREPVIEREGAEAENLTTARTEKDRDKLFWEFVQDWPNFAGMPKQPAKLAFYALTDEEQDQAFAKRDGWFALLKRQKKSHTPAPATYCREKLWKDVPDVDQAEPRNEKAGPFGKLWCVYRFADLLKSPYGRIPPPSQFQQRLIDGGGPAAEAEKRLRLAKYGWPRVSTMHAAALQRKGHVVPSEFSALAMQFEKVRVGSDLWEVWRQEHVQRGWPWLDECNPQEWVWMPGTGQPIDQSNLKEAVRSALTLFEEKLQHLQKDAAE